MRRNRLAILALAGVVSFFIYTGHALARDNVISLRLNGRDCAQRIILLAAKKNVAARFDNSPSSRGVCAMGVRTSLQRSRVGGVNGSLGNAIDFMYTLRPHGFVDSGYRDPRTAPPGSVLVFSGPKSNEYLRTKRMGRPAGTWVGHVTIKGDDGRYYTDGRTREPALGWVNSQNYERIRNMAATMVPGQSLSRQYEGRCSRLFVAEAVLDLELAANDASQLDVFSAEAEAEGRKLAREGLAQLEKLGSMENRSEAFREVLRLALEAGPFDDEGQLTEAVADTISTESALRAEYDLFLLLQPKRTGVERCKADRLQADVARAECMTGAGQDLQTKNCGLPFAFSRCLKEHL